MNVTKDIISDLFPIYAANECSADTRALVDEYLKNNPSEAEELRRILSSPVTSPMPHAAALDEVRSLREARRRIRRRSFLLGFAIFFALAPFSFIYSDGHTQWLFLESPKTALIYGALSLACWVIYAIMRHRSQSL